MKRFQTEKLAPEGDGGASITIEDFTELGNKIVEVAEGQKAAAVAADKVMESVEKINADLEIEMAKMHGQVQLLKSTLTAKYGPSGADDWLGEMAKFLTGCYQYGMSHGKSVDPDLTMSNGVKVIDLIKGAQVDKAAVDFTTAEAASAAVLLPTILRPGITELKSVYGNVYPRLTKLTVPAGHTVDMGKELTNPVATWRATQVTDIGEEATPMAFAKNTLNTMLAGSWIQVSNELIKSPHINFAAVATTRMVTAINKLVETGVIAGQDATAGPADGIINYTGVNDQGNIASATFALVVGFLQACVADNDWASNEAGSQLLMTATDALALAAEAVGASELIGMLVWGNPREGIPPTLLGRELIQHPALLATNRHMVLGDLGGILLGEDASYTIDVNPWLESAYKENASWIRVFNHYDWVLGQADEYHFTTVAAV